MEQYRLVSKKTYTAIIRNFGEHQGRRFNLNYQAKVCRSIRLIEAEAFFKTNSGSSGAALVQLNKAEETCPRNYLE